MKYRRLVVFLLVAALSCSSMQGQARVIVRDSLGEQALKLTCLLVHCTVTSGLDGTLGSLFLVTGQNGISLQSLLNALLGQLGVVDAEPDQALLVSQMTAPSGLYDTSPVNYYGATVWNGYVAQPAALIINLPLARSNYNVTGTGIVGVIDTGVDPAHPALQGILLSGRDFTRGQDGGSELTDVNQSTMAVVDGSGPVVVNQTTMAVVNGLGQSTFTQSQYAAFGHGTMVSGIIHLVAPTAQIMPLKSFHADGSGSLSDVLKAIYYAQQHGANILSMSFDFTTSSPEMVHAVNHVTGNGMICVASVGNDGQAVVVYPAGLDNVIGVASTTNSDTLSSFSNFGAPPVWLAAPGEGIITTYPYGTYAAGWGTSFSTPFVSGALALLRGVDPSLNQASAAQAVGNAVPLSTALNHGRLDINQAIAAWCSATHRC